MGRRGNNRTKRVYFNTSKGEYQRLEALAADHETTVGTAAREAALRDAERGARLTELATELEEVRRQLRPLLDLEEQLLDALWVAAGLPPGAGFG